MFTKLAPKKCDRSASRAVGPDEDDWEEADQADAKDVWLATGEMGKFLDTQAAFRSAGYRILVAEIVKTHPIWFFDLDRANAPRFRSGDKLLRYVRDALWQAGVRFKDEDVMIQPSGNRIIISFMWPTPARGERRVAAWEEGRIQSLLDQLP